MSRHLRVFLCHASQDKPAVWKLYRYLSQHGIRPWLDKADLVPGQNWEIEIPKALFNSDVILVCLSRNSVNKEGYVQKEIAFALDKALEKPEGTIFIIPVKLEDCDVPRRLGMYQWVDYYRPDGRKRLLVGLNLRAQDLGEEVSPVILEEARRSKPISKPVQLVQAEQAEKIEDVERGKLEREEAERIESEKREQAAREKAAFEQAQRDEAERMALEKTALIRAKRSPEANQNRENMEASMPQPPAFQSSRPVVYRTEPVVEPVTRTNFRWLGIGSVLFVALICVLASAVYVVQKMMTTPSGVPTEIATIPSTATVASDTPIPAETLTSIPVTLTPAPDIGSTMISEMDGMVLVYVPEGEFTMGGSGFSDEQPIHQVNLDGFWMDETEVTNSTFAQFLSSEGNQSEGGVAWIDTADEDVKIISNGEQWTAVVGYEDRPVVEVSWFGASAYCTWAGRSLPTEAQWEKAARGTDGRIYPWGNNSPNSSLLNFNGNTGYLSAVGSYPAGVSVYGALDMAGNVSEWVNDWYDQYYYSSAATTNPTGPSSGQSKVIRGGAWSNRPEFVNSSNRDAYDPTYSVVTLGFRCAVSE